MENNIMATAERAESVRETWADVEATTAEQAEEENLTLEFRKPYKFEAREYDRLDLSGLEDVTAADLAAVGKLVTKQGVVTPMPEMTMDYTLALAARVAKLPAEFFNGLPARETIRLKNLVTGFLYGGDGDN